jgi:hypothetical protein
MPWALKYGRLQRLFYCSATDLLCWPSRKKVYMCIFYVENPSNQINWYSIVRWHEAGATSWRITFPVHSGSLWSRRSRNPILLHPSLSKTPGDVPLRKQNPINFGAWTHLHGTTNCFCPCRDIWFGKGYDHWGQSRRIHTVGCHKWSVLFVICIKWRHNEEPLSSVRCSVFLEDGLLMVFTRILLYLYWSKMNPQLNKAQIVCVLNQIFQNCSTS